MGVTADMSSRESASAGAVRTTDLGIDGLSGAVHLGAGGSANVFAARKLDSGEQVAVKLLRASADSEKERVRFEREQDTLRLLSTHEGIVPVLDAGVTDREEPYFLMPLMEGSLQDRIDSEGGLDWQTATQLVVEVADAVSYAHEEHVLHRDIKPGNILLDDQGVPRVADFGIAKLVDSNVSKSSKSLGTPSFMPPERFNGVEATEATDVYGLAATLSALITGSAPFITGENDTDAAVMMRVVTEAPPSLAAHDVPAEVGAVVQAAMAKQPDERPSTVSEFAAKLRSALEPYLDLALTGPVTVAIPRRNITIPNGPATSPKSATVELGPDGDSATKKKWLVPIAVALFTVILGAGAVLAMNLNDAPDVEVAGADEVAEAADPTIDRDEISDGETTPEEGADDQSDTSDTSNTSGIDGDATGEPGDAIDTSYGVGDEGVDGTDDPDSAAGASTDTGAGNGGTPVVDPGPDPVVDPDPEPGPDPVVVVDPDPEPDPDPDPVVVVDPDPEPDPDPVVDPDPVPEPSACFTASSSSVTVGQSVSFSNCSTEADSYSWAFGDGDSSTWVSPSHTYSHAGTYEVRLTATGAGGTDWATRNITVTAVVTAGPDAEDRWVTLASDETTTASDLTKGTAVTARVIGDSSGSYTYSLATNGTFSHTRQSDDAYAFWIDYQVADADGNYGETGRINLNVEAKSTDNAPEDRSRVITMSAAQDQIDVNLLGAGGNSARWLGGDDKHALYGNGRYHYLREGPGADTHTFQFYELDNQVIIVRWTITVNVEAQ